MSVELSDYPTATTDVAISAHKAYLLVRFVPVVYRNGQYQRVNSFKLKLTTTPIAEARAAMATRATSSPNSVFANGRVVKIRVSDTGVYQLTHAELRRMGFYDPNKVRIYGYGGYLLSNRFANHPADDLPEVPIYHTGSAVLFYARGSVHWNWNSSLSTRLQTFYSYFCYYVVT